MIASDLIHFSDAIGDLKSDVMGVDEINNFYSIETTKCADARRELHEKLLGDRADIMYLTATQASTNPSCNTFTDCASGH